MEPNCADARRSTRFVNPTGARRCRAPIFWRQTVRGGQRGYWDIGRSGPDAGGEGCGKAEEVFLSPWCGCIGGGVVWCYNGEFSRGYSCGVGIGSDGIGRSRDGGIDRNFNSCAISYENDDLVENEIGDRNRCYGINRGDCPCGRRFEAGRAKSSARQFVDCSAGERRKSGPRNDNERG
ncbi:MAG: hypothetical protein JWO95_1230 [Verrucomicrobiales bacterium]|nr:hypothetical protein [Verrucomicrobiales bacterium]